MVGRLRAVLPVVLTLALAGVMVAAALPLAFDDTPDPAHLLTAARRAVEDAGSFRFAVRTQMDIDSPEGSRSAPPRRMSIDGSWSASRSYTRQAGSLGGADEAIVDGESSYHRSLESAEDKADQVWTMTEIDRFTDEGLAGELQRKALGLDDDDMEFVADQTAVEAAAWIYMGGTDASVATMAMTTGGYVGIDVSILGGFSGAPTGFLEAIAELGDGDVVYDGNGVTTLVATLRAPDDLVDAFDHPIPDGTVQLEVGPDQLPTTLRIRIEQGTVRSLTEVAFTDWDEPVGMPVPSGDQVDTTPWLDENGLRQLAGLTLVAPTALARRLGALRLLDRRQRAVRARLRRVPGRPAGLVRPGRREQRRERLLLDPAAPRRLRPRPGPDTLPARRPGRLPQPSRPGSPRSGRGARRRHGRRSRQHFPSAEQFALIASLAPADVEVLITVASERPPGW